MLSLNYIVEIFSNWYLSHVIITKTTYRSQPINIISYYQPWSLSEGLFFLLSLLPPQTSNKTDSHVQLFFGSFSLFFFFLLKSMGGVYWNLWVDRKQGQQFYLWLFRWLTWSAWACHFYPCFPVFKCVWSFFNWSKHFSERAKHYSWSKYRYFYLYIIKSLGLEETFKGPTGS